MEDTRYLRIYGSRTHRPIFLMFQPSRFNGRHGVSLMVDSSLTTRSGRTSQDRKDHTMSAFVVSKEHIDYLVSAAYGSGHDCTSYYQGWPEYRAGGPQPVLLNPRSEPDAIGRALWQENMLSVKHRYRGSDFGSLPGPCDFDHESLLTYRHR